MPKASDKTIVSYEKQVGVRHYSALEYFNKYIRRRYGHQKADELFDVLSRRGEGEEVDIYPLLHQSLDLSIDFLSLQSELRRNYMQWFLDQKFHPPKKVLDIACGNGFLTGFHAKMFPESEVIGIDISPAAIKCAQELMQRLNLKNVQFKVIDVTGTEFTSISEQFDLITAITAFNEALDFPDFDTTLPLRRLLRTYKESASVGPINHIPDLLSETGVFVSLERWNSLRSYGWWANVLHNAGLSIDFRKSHPILNKSLVSGDIDKVPVLWSQKEEVTVEHNLDNTIAFWLHSQNQKDFDNFRPATFPKELAEIVFISINPKTFLSGIKVNLEDLHTHRIELWQSGPFLLLFQFNTNGFRQLEVLPTIFIKDAEKRLEDIAEPMRDEAEVISYDAPEFDWS